MADHRLRLRASAAGAFLLELARQIRSLRSTPDLNTLLQQAPDLSLPKGIDPAWIRECAADLVAHGQNSLILVGRRQPVAIQALGLALNSALGAIGTTLLVQPQLSAPSTNLASLADKVRSGTIRTLVLLGGDPVYNAPTDLDWASLQSSVPNTIHLSPFFNATSARANWFIPLGRPEPIGIPNVTHRPIKTGRTVYNPRDVRHSHQPHGRKTRTSLAGFCSRRICSIHYNHFPSHCQRQLNRHSSFFHRGRPCRRYSFPRSGLHSLRRTRRRSLRQ